MADKTCAERNPDGYAYRYHSQLGGTVLRFNHGEDVNGGRPFEVVPYWFSPPDPPRGDGWEALRELQSQSIHESAQEIRSRIDIMLAAAPKETPSSPKRDSSMLLHEQDAWFADTLPAWRCQACGAFHNSERCPNHEGISRPKPTESPAEPAQDDEAAIKAWRRGSRDGIFKEGTLVHVSDLDDAVEIMRRLAREKDDLRAEVERLRTIITAAATQIRVAHEKEDEGAPCAASNHYEEALNMLADHAGAWSPECAKLRDFTTLGMVCKENSDLRAALIECGEIVGASVSEKCSSTFLCDVAGEVRLQVEKISAANAELRAKLAAAEQETKRLRSALRIADDIIVRGDDPSGNEPEDVCQIIESFVVVRAKLADAHEQLRCPDCGCATPEEAEAGECGCDSPVCSVEVTTTVAKELCDVAKKLAAAEAHQSYRPLIPGNLIDMIDEHGREWTRTDRVRSTVAGLVQPQTVEDITRLREKLAAAEERIGAIVEWTHQYGANLCPFGNYTDSFGDGMRAAKEQVSRIAKLGKGGA